MSSAAKRRGAEAEIWPVERAWLEGLEAERIPQVGREDEGDWWIRTRQGHLWVMQSKAVKKLSRRAALKDAKRQAENFAKHRGLTEIPRYGVLVRGVGMGRAMLDEWELFQSYGQLLERG